MYKIVKTKDGSHTIISPTTGDTYHSMGGAITESVYVYIKNGLLKKVKDFNKVESINILEVGFGTGLNCYLTRLNQLDIEINYTAIEPNPLPTDLIKSLNYTDILQTDRNFFNFIHSNRFNGFRSYSDDFNFYLIDNNFESVDFETKYDLIYYDGFSLNKDFDIWKVSNINKISNLLNSNGIMVTYASNTHLKKSLLKENLELEVLPGALSKREMIRAKKI